MKNYLAFSKLARVLWVVILLAGLMPVISAHADAPTAYAFPTFNTTTITANGAIYSNSLDVSSVPASDFLFFTVAADYKHGTPNSGWSNTMHLEITNGGSITYTTATQATQGRLQSEADTTLYWSGIFNRKYVGGGNLIINFFDTDSTAGGPYTSSLENVTVAIYPASTTSTTFSSYNTPTITSNGASYSTSLDVSHVPPDGYLFFTLVADWVHGTPQSAWSKSMQMELNNNDSVIYLTQGSSQSGALLSETDTTLYWSGILEREYIGGNNFTVKFIDPDTTTGGPFTSSLNNVVVSIYPSPTIPITFTSFTTPDIIGGSGGYTKTLDVSGLASYDYLFYAVVGDFKGGTNPSWSKTMMMTINDGASVIYSSKTKAQGMLPGAGDTTLYWTGIFDRKYTGGSNLAINFKDTYNDLSGPYDSHLENVRVSIFRGAGTGVTAIDLLDLNARSNPLASIQALFYFVKQCLPNVFK